MLTKSQAVALWWGNVLENGGRFNRVGQLAVDEPTIVAKEVLRASFEDWNNAHPEGCTPISVSEFSKLFAATVPGTQVVRPRSGSKQIPSWVIPRHG